VWIFAKLLGKRLLVCPGQCNKGTQKLQMSTNQAESNVQSLIDLMAYIMAHQMKGIGNGRQHV
jgi:hypothetical protein